MISERVYLTGSPGTERDTLVYPQLGSTGSHRKHDRLRYRCCREHDTKFYYPSNCDVPWKH